jgi:phosphoenolpyruvate synthase/pyruvate phosphate dikinase
MSTRIRRLLPLSELTAPASPAILNASWNQGVTAGRAGSLAGAKAARLAAAWAAGFPVLPGWVLPAAESRPAIRAGAAAVDGGRPAAARRAALSCLPDPQLAGELRAVVHSLGGRVIVRSSSPLEDDPRWAGAFSSVAEVGPGDVVTAVRSCWAAAFAVDPLARLASGGLPLDALELGLLIQPELRPAAGGTARVTPATGTTATQPSPVDVVVDGVRGHPGALLAGWAEGTSARVRLADPGAPDWPEPASDGPLTGLLGAELVAAVARLAAGVYWTLGDTSIEWAAAQETVWLLQATAAGPAAPPPEPAMTAVTGAGSRPGRAYPTRELMPLLAAAVQAGGSRLTGRPAAAGQAAGRLVACRPHERPAAGCRDAILLVDRPVPALAPLLFAARGVIARTGAAGAHLAEVARSLAVPMVTGCRPELVTGGQPARDGWLAAIDGSTGEVALLPA